MLASLSLRVGLLLLATITTIAAAADPPNLPDLPELTLRFDSPTTVIAAPQAAPYPEIARKLADALGHRPRLVPDTTAPADLGAGPVIALGNLMDSRLVCSLYLHAYDFTDYAWPSAGGHVLRTIRDPLGTGAHVLLIGGSDAKGVADAAANFIDILREQGAELHYLNRVKLGCRTKDIESYTAKYLATDEKVWLRTGQSGSWEYMAQIAQAGLGYLRTGNEAYLPVFKQELRRWFDHDVYHPSSEALRMLHGFMNRLILVWDLLRDHPLFTPDERRRIDNDFLYAFRSAEGPARNEGASNKVIVRDNHGTRTALDGIFGGRYFHRRFSLPDAKRWLDITDRYFAAQMTSAKPVCDDWDQQWPSTLDDTLLYAMATGQDAYLKSESFRLAADRALIANADPRVLRSYLCACAVATGDNGYLSGWPEGSSLPQACAAMTGLGEEIMRGFCTGAPASPRTDLLGPVIAPLDALWYNTIDATGFNPGGIFAVTEKREAGFDKVSIREGWDENDFYLLLDGISGGHHAYQDANCLVRYRDAGRLWLGIARRFFSSAGPRSQNGLFIALDGAGPGRIHRYARLLYADHQGEYSSVAGSLENLGDTVWQRHILRKRDRWTLIVDRVMTTRPGELLAERSWYVYGIVTPSADGLISEQKQENESRFLHLQSAGTPQDGIRCVPPPPDHGESHTTDVTTNATTSFHETVRAAVAASQPVEMAALLNVVRGSDKSDLRLTSTTEGWRIDDRDGTVTAAISTAGRLVFIGQEQKEASVQPRSKTETLPPPTAPDLALNWRSHIVGPNRLSAVALGEDGRAAAGDVEGNVAAFTSEGDKLLAVKLQSPILSLHFVGTDLVVGENRGALTRLAPDGTQRWQVVIPYVPMAWPYWSEYASRVREITSADINGDGKPEILIGNSDRRIHAFDDAGRELWKASVEWGIFTAMTTGLYGNSFGLYGGTSHPSIHGRCIVFGPDGKVRKHYSRSDIESWSCPSQMRDMRLADVDGDGRQEIVTAIDTNCRQLIVYKPDGVILWDADVAGAAEAIAIAPAQNNKPATLWCSSTAGYVAEFDGKTGSRRWTRFVGEPATFIAPYGQGVLAVAPSGTASLVDHNGTLAGRNSIGSAATAFLRPGDARATGATAIGTADGRLLILRKPTS